MAAIRITKEEAAACQPVPLNPRGFNPKTQIPFGLQPDHIRSAMREFLDFLGFVNIVVALKADSTAGIFP